MSSLSASVKISFIAISSTSFNKINTNLNDVSFILIGAYLVVPSVQSCMFKIMYSLLKSMSGNLTTQKEDGVTNRYFFPMPSRIVHSDTVNIICGLIKSQKTIKNITEWCEVYNLTNRVREEKSLFKDIKDEAIKIIFGYMDGYKAFCKCHYL